jgi:hypothetical protein
VATSSPPAVQAEMVKGVVTTWQPTLQYGLGVMLADPSITAGQGRGIGQRRRPHGVSHDDPFISPTPT